MFPAERSKRVAPTLTLQCNHTECADSDKASAPRTKQLLNSHRLMLQRFNKLTIRNHYGVQHRFRDSNDKLLSYQDSTKEFDRVAGTAPHTLYSSAEPGTAAAAPGSQHQVFPNGVPDNIEERNIETAHVQVPPHQPL